MQLHGHRCIFSETVVASPLKLMNSSVMETVMVLYILAISTWSIKDFPWGNIAKKRFQRFRTMFDSNWYQFDIKLKLSLKVNFQLILFHSRHFWRETDKTYFFLTIYQLILLFFHLQFLEMVITFVFLFFSVTLFHFFTFSKNNLILHIKPSTLSFLSSHTFQLLSSPPCIRSSEKVKSPIGN